MLLTFLYPQLRRGDLLLLRRTLRRFGLLLLLLHTPYLQHVAGFIALSAPSVYE